MSTTNTSARPGFAPIAQLLAPRSVAVIGASEDQTKFGGRLYRMLLKHQYAGQVYPINPVRETLFGLKTYPSVSATPEAPDMVVMALPRDKVKGEIAASARRGARCGIVITAKFSDAGPEGAALEREIVAIAHDHGMRLIGPNCLGVISPANKVVLSSSPALDVDVLPLGRIGFVSQSGALMATIFDRAMEVGVGFSHCVSVGNQADLELADFVEYLIEDDRTSVICSYVEGIKDPARFVTLARRARLAGKPWLMVKAGRTDAGTRAAFSHTASIAGSHAVLASVCRDEQVTMLEEPGAMITLAAVLSRHPQAVLRNVAILTTSGGGGALAADALSARKVPLASFEGATRTRLDELYSTGQALNPVDLGGRKFDEAADVSGPTAKVLVDDPATDAVLAAITTAPNLKLLAQELTLGMADDEGREQKPIFYVMQPGHAADAARSVLREKGAPYTNFTGEAIDALAAWHQRGRFVARGVAQRPAGLAAVRLGPCQLDETASKEVLASVGVPVNASRRVHSRRGAVEAAEAIGYPVVMKIAAPEVVHKSDVGGVKLDLRTAQAVETAWDEIFASARRALLDTRIEGVSVQAMAAKDLEMIVGARRDPQFGPIVVVGAGGVLVELLPDRIIATAPLAADDVRHLLEQLTIWPLLAGYRGKALAVDAVIDTIVRISWLAHDLREQDFELDVNPLLVTTGGVCAVDARIRVG